MDIALENVKTQKCGLVFIYDMSDSKYSNFDYDLSQKILTLLKVSWFNILFTYALTNLIAVMFILEAGDTCIYCYGFYMSGLLCVLVDS